MSPELISTVRLTIRIAVVLPHPEGPTSTQISPAGTVSERWSTAFSRAPAYRLTTSRNSSSAASAGADTGLGHAIRPPPRGGPGRGGAPPAPHRAARLAGRGVLQIVIERRELVLPGGGGDQPVGEPRVLGQQRAVQVGPDDR